MAECKRFLCSAASTSSTSTPTADNTNSSRSGSSRTVGDPLSALAPERLLLLLRTHASYSGELCEHVLSVVAALCENHPAGREAMFQLQAPDVVCRALRRALAGVGSNSISGVSLVSANPASSEQAAPPAPPPALVDAALNAIHFLARDHAGNAARLQAGSKGDDSGSGSSSTQQDNDALTLVMQFTLAQGVVVAKIDGDGSGIGIEGEDKGVGDESNDPTGIRPQLQQNNQPQCSQRGVLTTKILANIQSVAECGTAALAALLGVHCNQDAACQNAYLLDGIVTLLRVYPHNALVVQHGVYSLNQLMSALVRQGRSSHLSDKLQPHPELVSLLLEGILPLHNHFSNIICEHIFTSLILIGSSSTAAISASVPSPISASQSHLSASGNDCIWAAYREMGLCDHIYIALQLHVPHSRAAFAVCLELTRYLLLYDAEDYSGGKKGGVGGGGATVTALRALSSAVKTSPESAPPTVPATNENTALSAAPATSITTSVSSSSSHGINNVSPLLDCVIHGLCLYARWDCPLLVVDGLSLFVAILGQSHHDYDDYNSDSSRGNSNRKANNNSARDRERDREERLAGHMRACVVVPAILKHFNDNSSRWGEAVAAGGGSSSSSSNRCSDVNSASAKQERHRKQQLFARVLSLCLLIIEQLSVLTAYQLKLGAEFDNGEAEHALALGRPPRPQHLQWARAVVFAPAAAATGGKGGFNAALSSGRSSSSSSRDAGSSRSTDIAVTNTSSSGKRRNARNAFTPAPVPASQPNSEKRRLQLQSDESDYASSQQQSSPSNKPKSRTKKQQQALFHTMLSVLHKFGPDVTTTSHAVADVNSTDARIIASRSIAGFANLVLAPANAVIFVSLNKCDVLVGHLKYACDPVVRNQALAVDCVRALACCASTHLEQAHEQFVRCGASAALVAALRLFVGTSGLRPAVAAITAGSGTSAARAAATAAAAAAHLEYFLVQICTALYNLAMDNRVVKKELQQLNVTADLETIIFDPALTLSTKEHLKEVLAAIRF